MKILESEEDVEINLEVIDHGLGIPEEDQDKLFKPTPKITTNSS